MLYDPKWEKEAEQKTGPSMPHFIAWLETKDPNERYDFDNCKGYCLVGQYMTHCGDKYRPGPDGYQKYCAAVGGTGLWYSVPVVLNEPHTFGAALERARKFTAER